MKLREIAELVDGSVLGDDTVEITGITNIEEAGSSDIVFAVPPHLEKAAASRAAAVIIPLDSTEFAKPAVRVENPRVAFVKLLKFFMPPPDVERGVHATAVLGKDVKLGDNVAIMANAVIGDHVAIGDNTVIYPNAYIGNHVVIGSDALIYSNVSVREDCRIGSRVILQNGAVIGSDGFGFVSVQGRHHKVPQVGNVIIEDDVEVGANTCIDRATISSTVVKRGTKIDNLVHLGHNVVIGEDCFVVALTGISGSTKVGNHVTFAGQVGSTGHITIGDNCVFAARTGIIGDVAAGSFYAGFPAKPHKEWLKSEAYINKLPDLVKRVRELEKRLAELPVTH
ncbi:UDP-3-O-acylglucosamine N-acyltransferase [Propionispora sp. 2/2-37]|uniref:UDP-3-O-(3-hydroxymyristoyl)glucosamine N-acyltransferase n=1 Tax=Propionispora sp. 2/2-37 TaxID=1677858 RepID=UPI0006BB6EE5|nr:UDP-3-O-(3-hydroxymyristoyl)glucosamine N-acyltransferase [Propionispora sp. 2/2-37]CUH94541.1 UDP-3-O-acylglucosamine N-acyltransferase [Propionispora sp. 2/2-37]